MFAFAEAERAQAGGDILGSLVIFIPRPCSDIFADGLAECEAVAVELCRILQKLWDGPDHKKGARPVYRPGRQARLVCFAEMFRLPGAYEM
jgi:hypothetical protein